MKTKSSPRPVPARRPAYEGGFLDLRVIALLTSVSGVFLLALGGFVTANPSKGDGRALGAHSNRPDTPRAPSSSQLTGRTFARVTPEGVITQNLFGSGQKDLARATRLLRSSTWQTPERFVLPPLGNTLWLVDDENAIADGVAIDANDVWGAWTLQGARLSAYPILGDGTPDFEFSSFDSGSSGVASAKGADRMAYLESNAPGNDFRIHGFKSTSNGIPDWSFPFPETDPNLPASSKRLAVSRDGSTVAAIVSDEPATQSSKLYVFEADTGEIRSTRTDSLRMDGVDLTDDGSIALVSAGSSFSLDRLVVASTALQWTNSAFLRVRDEVQKFAGSCTKIHRGCFLQRLRNIQSAQVNEFECRPDFVSILRAESGATQSDHVHSKNRIAFCCDYKWRQIFSESRTALYHHQPSNVHVLMKCRSTAEECRIVHTDMTGQQTVVGDDHVVSNLAIMAEMRTCH